MAKTITSHAPKAAKVSKVAKTAKTPKSSKRTNKFSTEKTPELSVETARAAFTPAWAKHLARVRTVLLSLAHSQPQVLLFEGGTESERQAMARWWAALIHCENATHAPHTSCEHREPCEQCLACVQIGAGIYFDVLAYDGRISNKEDEENPGSVRAFTIESARSLKARMGDNSHSNKKRVVIMSGIDISREPAANALLKVLEEPSPNTLFVLLTPQREQLLPTLVSRSWVITLPWPSTRYVDDSLAQWEQSLADFLRTGRDWWPLTAAKGSLGTVDHNKAAQILLLCQKRLLPALAGDPTDDSPLAYCFVRVKAEQQWTLARLLDDAQQALQYNVNAARVLDWLATRMYIMFRT